jgi:hypothetical protein
VSKFVEYPFDTIKVWKQTQYQYSASEFGIRQLYRGISAPLSAAMIENAINFSVYGFTMRKMKEAGFSAEFGSVIGGGAAGLCVAHLATPVELVKCRMQMGQANSPVSVLREIIRSESGVLKSLYCGHVATLIREIPGGMIYFGTYENIVQLIVRVKKLKGREQVGALGLMSAGSIGGMAFWILTYPADFVKSRQQTQILPQSGMEILREAYHQKGLRGIYAGLGISLIRAIPANAAIFYAYETMTRILEPL